MSDPISQRQIPTGKLPIPNLWIKICGNTSLADAELAAEAGADAVGFIFASSPRSVTIAQVAAIVPHLPSAVEKVGVFVDAPLSEIVSTIEACSLTGVQLHFDALPELSTQLRRHFGLGLRILSVVHFSAEQNLNVAGQNFRPTKSTRSEDAATREGALVPAVCFSDPNINAILIDSRTPQATGGTGQTYDWIAAGKTLFQNECIEKPLIVAGGLTPANVAEAIATLHPWGVDVVSGVESTPGKKNPAAVRAFIANARATAMNWKIE